MRNDRKEEIVLKAAQIIRDEGYDRLTLSSLAAKMNMQKASLYYYFDSKEDLMDSIYTYFEEDCLHLGFSVDFSLSPEEIFSTALSHWKSIFSDRKRSCFISLIEQRKEIDERAFDDANAFYLMIQSQSEAVISVLGERHLLDVPSVKTVSTMFSNTIYNALVNESLDAEVFIRDFLSAFSI